MSILIIAGHDNHALHISTASAVTAASLCGSRIDVLLMGFECGEAAKAAANIQGVSRVLLADAPQFQYGLAENAAEQVLAVAAGYTHILAPATAFGKSVLPRVAARLDVEMVSEVTRVLAPDTFERPFYAGNVIATVQSAEPVKVLTIRATAFKAAAAEGGPATIETLVPVADTGKSVCLSRDVGRTGRPDLSAARVIVAGGQGVGSAEGFGLLEALADTLGGAVGASRAAVDAGFVKNDLQIGQTGKIVAPERYFAIGISGAIQHVAGIKDAKTIVAINHDPEAPIFLVADYGLAGDLHELLPRLIAELRS
ncbi:MAG: FAD-binding protein [Burkholderiaceae bacterium]|jgi:electron transfer flavoprotein alpha subunit|nr:FAD-binding protein [Burkholderiaceae bacterium]